MSIRVIGKVFIDGKKYSVYGPKRSHPYIKVGNKEFSIQLDVEIAPLILQLWKTGIGTLNCCQGTDGHHGYIQFLPKDAYELLKWIDGGVFEIFHSSPDWSTVSIVFHQIPILRDVPSETVPSTQDWFQLYLKGVGGG